MSRRDAAYVARELGKTENWVKRNAATMPAVHKAGRTYYWTDEDIQALHDAYRVRRDQTSSEALRPVAARRRTA